MVWHSEGTVFASNFLSSFRVWRVILLYVCYVFSFPALCFTNNPSHLPLSCVLQFDRRKHTGIFFKLGSTSYSVFEIKTSDLQPEQFREEKQGKHLGVELMLPLFSASGKAIRARRGIAIMLCWVYDSTAWSESAKGKAASLQGLAGLCFSVLLLFVRGCRPHHEPSQIPLLPLCLLVIQRKLLPWKTAKLNAKINLAKPSSVSFRHGLVPKPAGLGQLTAACGVFQMMTNDRILGNIKHPMKHLQLFWPHHLLLKGYLYLHRLSQAISGVARK